MKRKKLGRKERTIREDPEWVVSKAGGKLSFGIIKVEGRMCTEEEKRVNYVKSC